MHAWISHTLNFLWETWFFVRMPNDESYRVYHSQINLKSDMLANVAKVDCSGGRRHFSLFWSRGLAPSDHSSGKARRSSTSRRENFTPSFPTSGRFRQRLKRRSKTLKIVIMRKFKFTKVCSKSSGLDSTCLEVSNLRTDRMCGLSQLILFLKIRR